MSEYPGLSDKVTLPPVLHLRDSSLLLKEKTVNSEIALFEHSSREADGVYGVGLLQFAIP